MKNNTKDKYIACMILHAVGDTVGYKNSEWEFKKGGYEKTLEKFYEFLDLGGVNHISLKDWRVSDDTILHIQTAVSILQDFENINQLGQILKKNYLDALQQFETEGLEYRYPGTATLNNLKRLRDGGNWDDTPYDVYAGGAGAAMRNLCIGLAFYGEKNRHKLIQISIESSRMTHNSVIGYLGGMTSAFFTALAIEKIEINKWPFMLIDLFETGVISKYIKLSGRGEDSYKRDAHVFIDKWSRYISDKFDDQKNVIRRRTSRNLVYRSKYYHETFGYKYEGKGNQNFSSEDYGYIGSGGDDSVIIAYDCLIDSGQNWEKLVIYSMLHIGDTDTTGAIAGGFYGALYGFTDVPKNFLEHLEYKKEINEIGVQLYEKFYKN
jgi:ADP-ribosylarginine hydrolase